VQRAKRNSHWRFAPAEVADAIGVLGCSLFINWVMAFNCLLAFLPS